MSSSQNLNASNVGNDGDIFTFAVAVAVGDGLAATGDGRPTHRQISCELHAGISSSINAAEIIIRIVVLLCQLLQDVIQDVLITAVQMAVRLCTHYVNTARVESSVNHASEIISVLGLKLWRGSTNIGMEMMKYIWTYIINSMINGYCNALTLCSTNWTTLWQCSKLSIFSGQQTIVDGSRSEGTECLVGFINH